MHDVFQQLKTQEQMVQHRPEVVLAVLGSQVCICCCGRCSVVFVGHATASGMPGVCRELFRQGQHMETSSEVAGLQAEGA
jgi:hypothetical protein